MIIASHHCTVSHTEQERQTLYLEGKESEELSGYKAIGISESDPALHQCDGTELLVRTQLEHDVMPLWYPYSVLGGQRSTPQEIHSV